MRTSTMQRRIQKVAHAFADLMNTYRATFQGPFMGLSPTGRPVVMHSIDIWRVVDGMAVEHWDQLDGQAFFAQLAGEAGSR